MITELNHYLHGKCDTSLLLFLVISLMSLKKYCKIWGGVLPPPIPPLPSRLKRNLFRPPPLRFQNFAHTFLPLRFTYQSASHLHPIQIFHVLPFSPLPPHPDHVIMSCRSVMSLCLCHTVIHICHLVTCQVVMSSCHTYTHKLNTTIIG